MKQLLLAAALFAAACSSGQSLEYAWLNQPCATVLNCDSGCTACLLPEVPGFNFTGTAAVWQGIDACPQPITSGDNTVLTYGWPAIPDFNHYVAVSGIAYSPVHIDSIIVRHTADVDGPQRLLMRYAANTTMPTAVVSDVAITGSYSETVVTDLGNVAATDGMIYGFFQILLQAYDGGAGAWKIDDLRIVASPGAATAVEEVLPVQQHPGPMLACDALGKSIGPTVASGMYLNGKRVVVLH